MEAEEELEVVRGGVVVPGGVEADVWIIKP